MALDPGWGVADIRRPAPTGVRWQSGDAEDCKSSNAGSIPARTSRRAAADIPVLAGGRAALDVGLRAPRFDRPPVSPDILSEGSQHLGVKHGPAVPRHLCGVQPREDRANPAPMPRRQLVDHGAGSAGGLGPYGHAGRRGVGLPSRAFLGLLGWPAGGRTRTDMALRPADFESAVSTVPPHPHGTCPIHDPAPRRQDGAAAKTRLRPPALGAIGASRLRSRIAQLVEHAIVNR